MTQNSSNPENFSGCPNLETLKLIDIRLEKNQTLFINAPNLKSLELSFGQPYMKYGRKVVIDGPGLMTFKYKGFPSIIVCSSDDLASIDDAYFHIYDWYISGLEEEDKNEDEDRGKNCIDIYSDEFRDRVLCFMDTLKKFCHAKSLTLSLESVEALATFPCFLDEIPSPFANLKHLKIEREPGQECMKVKIPAGVLNYFLNSSTVFELC
ncbi:hypothetical protein COLO4_38580 [Corchorus olitorius]|uniref:Uncharacterized protein n=1 Tax=Corchorus olitorius TaxID=93759 RepID=A0A1R3FTZ9_9ROSI|nr:hypothetical protein COLO4_38580 [Corchorus olitorius]